MIVVLSTLTSVCPSAIALNPALDINQYVHNAWTTGDEAAGFVTSIVQTGDGYLWLGTEFGLRRFDGNRFVPWQPPPGSRSLPGTTPVSALLASRDGRLWIGTDRGLATWKDGHVTSYAELAGHQVSSILEDSKGTVWVANQALPNGLLCAIRDTNVRCYGQDGRFGRWVAGLREYNGSIWATAMTGLWRWGPGPPRLYPLPNYADQMSDEGGHLIIGTAKGLLRLAGDKIEPYTIPLAGKQFSGMQLLRDRDGGIWVGTEDRGLLHVHQGRTDIFGRADGLSSDYVNYIFEDREGDVWVGTKEGIDRFRNITVSTFSGRQGLSADVTSVLSDRDGSVWLGTHDGVDHWQNGQVTVFRKADGMPDDSVQCLFQGDDGQIWASTPFGISRFEQGRFRRVTAAPAGFVRSMAGDAANLWISSVDHGLVHLRQGKLTEQIPWASLGRKDFAEASVYDSSRGGLWLGFYEGGVAYLKNGRIRHYTEADGLAPGRVGNLYLDGNDGVWASTIGGLSLIQGGRIATLNSKNGLPCDSVHWVMEDNERSFWLYTACGLVRIARAELDAWVANPKHAIQKTIFGAADGVNLHAVPVDAYSPTVAKASDGKLWFATGAGAGIIDPQHLEVNRLAPPVHIEKIISDREARWQNLSGANAANLRLPALSRDLEIDYTALSLVVPEKNQFKYKLEGYDRYWQDAGNRRQAFYTNLSPRKYRFRVIASNNSGVWNEAGDTLEFSIDPAYYQTNWFRALILALVLAAAWGVYRLRLAQVAREFTVRMEERVGERTRIARDLHDTLLQSFQGVLLKLDAVTYLIRSRPEEAEKVLDSVIGQAQAAVVEGREAVHDLRASTKLTNDLAQALRDAGDEMAAEGDAAFRLVLEGSARDLRPIVRDEIYRISREALRNAFSHARARRIEVELTYSVRLLRLRIRDDGAGIPQVLLKGGREGHFGLAGMRERATQIGAKLNIWSRVGAGTEVDLSISGLVAYASPGRSRPGLFWRETG